MSEPTMLSHAVSASDIESMRRFFARASEFDRPRTQSPGNNPNKQRAAFRLQEHRWQKAERERTP